MPDAGAETFAAVALSPSPLSSLFHWDCLLELGLRDYSGGHHFVDVIPA
jgi:hypothetical protein